MCTCSESIAIYHGYLASTLWKKGLPTGVQAWANGVCQVAGSNKPLTGIKMIQLFFLYLEPFWSKNDKNADFFRTGVSDHGLIPFSEIPRFLHNSTPRPRLPDVCDGSRGTTPRGDGELVDWGAKCEENRGMWCNLTINLGWGDLEGMKMGLAGRVCFSFF